MPNNGLPTSTMHRSALRSLRKPEPRSIPQLVEEVERDYQFKLGYLVIQSLIQSASVTIEIDQQRADRSRVELLRNNLHDVWVQSLPHSTRAFAYGRAAFEKTYTLQPAHQLYRIAGLDYLPPESTQLVLDDQGHFAGIELSTDGDGILLGPERAWWFALDPTATEPHGRSRYLGAPREIWRARRTLEQEEKIWFSKFAIGHGVARAPDRPTTPPSMQDGPPEETQIDPMEALRQELAAIESGGTLILSSKTYADGKYHYDYQESQGQRDATPLEHRRQMLDVAALRSLGIPERAITQDSQTGSRAIAQVHLEVLYRTAEGILDQIAASFDRYVVAKAIDVNFAGSERPSHRVRWKSLGTKDLAKPNPD